MIEELTLALITLRTYARSSSLGNPVREAIEQLDKAGVFAALDEQAETAKAEGILAEVAVKSLSEAPFAQEQRSGRMSTISPPIAIDTPMRGTHT